MALTMTASHLTPTLPHGERLTHKGFHYDSPTAHLFSGHGETHTWAFTMAATQLTIGRYTRHGEGLTQGLLL